MKKIKSYQFTLTLRNVNDKTKNLEDHLYDANCDDALIYFRNNSVYLEFDREASSFENAVISAIQNVESTDLDIEVVSVSPQNLVSESDIAKRLGKSRQAISLWTKAERRKAFPQPILRLSEKSPLWNWAEVTKWLYDNKIIDQKEMVDDAVFIANLNVVLDERDKNTRAMRSKLLKKITFNHTAK